MENPHAERQAVLLERIVKNAVSVTLLHKKETTITSFHIVRTSVRNLFWN